MSVCVPYSKILINRKPSEDTPFSVRLANQGGCCVHMSVREVFMPLLQGNFFTFNAWMRTDVMQSLLKLFPGETICKRKSRAVSSVPRFRCLVH